MKTLFIFLIIFLFLLPFSKTSKSLRIMTFNIHFGNTITNEYDILNISQVIKDSQSDIVCLQEVDNNWSALFLLFKFNPNHISTIKLALLHLQPNIQQKFFTWPQISQRTIRHRNTIKV